MLLSLVLEQELIFWFVRRETQAFLICNLIASTGLETCPTAHEVCHPAGCCCRSLPAWVT